MREISLVEKVETSALVPNAVHITTKSKVSTWQLVSEVLVTCSSLNGSDDLELLQLFFCSAGEFPVCFFARSRLFNEADFRFPGKNP